MPMPSKSIAELVQEATTAISAGRHSEAIAPLRRATELAPDDGNLFMMFGMELSRVGEKEEATEALKRAVVLMPEDPRPAANLAVHMYQNGPKILALGFAEKALELDPFNQEAQEIVNRMKNPGPWVASLAGSPFWAGIGWGLVALGAAVTLTMAMFPPITPPSGQGMEGSELKRDILSVTLIGLWAVMGIGSMWWVIIDMLYRRTRFTWVAPMFVFGICGAPALPLAFYLLVGRKYSGRLTS